MSWQEEVFGPMAERTLENAQLYHLAHAYDFGRDSRLAKAIVQRVNLELDGEENRRGVLRIRPGELYLRTRRGPLILPLRLPEDVHRVVAGERWESVRRDILQRCEARFRTVYPEASDGMVRAFLHSLWNWHRASKGQIRRSPWLASRARRPWGMTVGLGEPIVELDEARRASRLDGAEPRPAHRPETFERLSHFLRDEAGVPPAVHEAMLLDLMSLRARFAPRASMLRTGQMPLCAMHVDSSRSLWQETRYQPLAPVVVSVFAGSERHELRTRPLFAYEDYLAFHGTRLARMMMEAYRQDGLLSFAELQWISLLSTGTVSRAVDYYQRTHNVILLCPGSVLDMGRMLTHKDIIVRLHLQGLSVLEIARQTYHNPRSVDAYLKAFDAVLILHIYGLPPELMAGVLGHGVSLVNEYLGLIAEHLKDIEQMREYLRRRGVGIPRALASGSNN